MGVITKLLQYKVERGPFYKISKNRSIKDKERRDHIMCVDTENPSGRQQHLK